MGRAPNPIRSKAGVRAPIGGQKNRVVAENASEDYIEAAARKGFGGANPPAPTHGSFAEQPNAAVGRKPVVFHPFVSAFLSHSSIG